jgi:hypothetical protein
MKKLNKFLEVAPIWKISIFGWAFTSLFTSFLFFVIGKFPLIVSLKIGAVTGFPFGLLFLLTISIIRKSSKFWDAAKEVENLIELAETRDELISILDIDMPKLREKSQSSEHHHELGRLFTIMKTKLKYVK